MASSSGAGSVRVGEPIEGQPFKRKRIDYGLINGQLCTPVSFTGVLPRPRLMPLVPKIKSVNPGHAEGSALSSPSAIVGPELPRPPTSVHLDNYLTLVGNMYYTSAEMGSASKDWSLLRRTTLGSLTVPTRVPNVWDKWAPLEIAKFESAICLNGKQFGILSRVVGSKSPSECVEFYYAWKSSKNYSLWKASFREPEKLRDA